jgi:hypothetical protein
VFFVPHIVLNISILLSNDHRPLPPKPRFLTCIWVSFCALLVSRTCVLPRVSSLNPVTATTVDGHEKNLPFPMPSLSYIRQINLDLPMKLTVVYQHSAKEDPRGHRIFISLAVSAILCF